MAFAFACLLSVIFLVYAYLIGVKGKLHLLLGFNEEEVTDRQKLAKTSGIFLLFLGLSLLPVPFLREWIGLAAVIIYIIIFYIGLYMMILYVGRFHKPEKAE